MLRCKSALPIEKMSRDEKLRAMEELWESLSQDESDYESPRWHEDVVPETAERYAAGQEQPIDWSEAKHELRKRAESSGRSRRGK